MSFALVKIIHVSCAAMTITIYFLRGIWMIIESPHFNQTWTKKVSLVIDSILLLTGIYMATQIHQYPFSDNWFLAKLLAIIAYIVIAIAGFRSKFKRIRVVSWAVAMAVFVYIFLVARSHNPFPFAGFF